MLESRGNGSVGFQMNNKHEEIVHALTSRLAELTGNVAEIDRELRKPLPARNDEQATDLENQDPLAGIEKSKLQEIQQIELALKRIAEGSYGSCSECGAIISPQRLKALPTATRCISCAA
jgi:DnaK suppressor protein